MANSPPLVKVRVNVRSTRNTAHLFPAMILLFYPFAGALMLKDLKLTQPVCQVVHINALRMRKTLIKLRLNVQGQHGDTPYNN